MHRINNIWTSLFGDLDQISSERYFVTLTSLISAIFLLILCIVHLSIGLEIVPLIITGISTMILLFLYFFLRFSSYLFIPKVILTGLGLILIDLTWYTKYLSNGPVLFFILIFAALVIWIWEGKCLTILLVYYFLNLAVLAIIDLNTPDYMFKYADPDKRSLDIYLSFFFYSSLMIILLYLVKKEFIRQKQKALKSDQLKSAFLANMSHEIRTPMNAIVGFSQLLGDGVGSDNKQQYIKIIQNSSDNLLRLINDIIDLSKIEADDVEIKYSEVSVHNLFVELKNVYSVELLKREKTDVKLSYNLTDDIIVQTDALRLRQILANLLSNALKFTSYGTITFSCENKGKNLIFKVSDTGTGIPEGDKPKIFDRFTKFNYQGMNTDGTGIGLSIAEKLVTILGGRIWFNSIAGKGSDFYFTIPDDAPKNQSTLKKKNQMNQKINMPSNPESFRPILVVEDDKTSYMLIKEFLRPLNTAVHHVTDGIDAINFIKRNPDVCLILMDIKLPFMDGYEATKAIKQTNPDIPIIVQTANAMIGDKEKALDAGCNDYITKPLDLKRLQEIVKPYLN